MVEAETKPEGENVPICNDYNQALPTQQALRSTAAQKASNSAPRVVFRCSDNPHGEQRTSLLEERTNLSLCFFAGFTLCLSSSWAFNALQLDVSTTSSGVQSLLYKVTVFESRIQ